MAIGSADKPLPKRSDQQRHTTKIEPISKSGWLGLKVSGGTLTLLIAIALGGAVLGSLGSQVVAYLASDHQGGGAAGAGGTAPGSAATGLLSKASGAADRLLEIDQALQGRDFGTALLLADEGLRLYPGDQQFHAKRQRAEDEIQNRFRYQTLESAITRQNFVAAMAIFEEIPAESTFKAKAKDDLDAARDQYIAEQLRDALTAAKLSLCSEAKSSAQTVLNLDSNNAGARAILSDCDK
jgi:hypothetical protein